MLICTERDRFIQDWYVDIPRWQVILNNGQTVYQDDGRPNVIPNSAWERLYYHCKENNLYIVDMMIGFRSNCHSLSSNMDGYYFCKGSRGAFGLDKTLQLFFAGTLNNNELIVECWKVPEMIKEKSESRQITDTICLIRKNTNQFLEQKD